MPRRSRPRAIPDPPEHQWTRAARGCGGPGPCYGWTGACGNSAWAWEYGIWFPARLHGAAARHPLVTTRELAAVLGVTADTIRGWVRSWRIPCLRVGQKTLRFDREAVLAAIRDGHGSEGGAA
ncbi:MAG: DNA-binding protein [Leptolyngbya sp. PLA2]|nr:DNA-binding protein [Leptolyngbya sp.]MCE7972330.1 DNA-binding protein [Leptolyngbya sp. PL-A2]MCQ3939478.1 hypothetical protein [cyanobacterium CYA1]MCZ7632266.1 helix-turn-helix domain-containing protein [Phycisphaerales bacterium]MDL1903736.1 helix-turn-helix domain-containing protein [Synechococcales cyanobacterium CNB]GIK18460.1 MAG: hypothetical protein BroJett004_06240 [Planctomycetota bacterium]